MAINVWVHWAEAQTPNDDNLMYWMCSAACWFLSNHSPTSFQLLTLGKNVLGCSQSVSRDEKKGKGRGEGRRGFWPIECRRAPAPSARFHVVGECNNEARYCSAFPLENRRIYDCFSHSLHFPFFRFPHDIDAMLLIAKRKISVFHATDRIWSSRVGSSELSFDGNNFTIWATWLFSVHALAFPIQLNFATRNSAS